MATEESKPVYEPTFTAEAITGLVDHLKKSIQDYALANGKDGKFDYFLIYAALGQTAFEMSYNTLPKTEEDKDISRKETSLIVDGLLAKIDGLRAEFKTRGTSDLMAAAQFMGILAEIYCKRRDAAVMNMLEQQQNNQAGDAQQ